MIVVQDDVPDFEFVDLPGIQTFPEEQLKRTSQLVSKYLSEPDTLVLCVVDATTPALDSILALKRSGMLASCLTPFWLSPSQT